MKRYMKKRTHIVHTVYTKQHGNIYFFLCQYPINPCIYYEISSTSVVSNHLLYNGIHKHWAYPRTWHHSGMVCWRTHQCLFGTQNPRSLNVEGKYVKRIRKINEMVIKPQVLLHQIVHPNDNSQKQCFLFAIHSDRNSIYLYHILQVC